MTSRRCHFVGGLSNKKAESCYSTPLPLGLWSPTTTITKSWILYSPFFPNNPRVYCPGVSNHNSNDIETGSSKLGHFVHNKFKISFMKGSYHFHHGWSYSTAFLDRAGFERRIVKNLSTKIWCWNMSWLQARIKILQISSIIWISYKLVRNDFMSKLMTRLVS